MEIAFEEVVEAVVTAIPRADASAIVAALYRDRGPELWAFGRRLGLRPEECEDAVQEAHLRLLATLSRGDLVDDPPAWLFRVFYRIAMDRHRLSRRLMELLQRQSIEPAESRPDRSLAMSVWAAVDGLPIRQRAAVYLHYRADMSFDRVADVMGITPGAARTHSSRGVETIRRRLAAIDEADR
jgi:RNA polymerase sigma-70 factor (ECF subfamily)